MKKLLDHPEYASAHAKLAELQTARSAAMATESRIVAQLNQHANQGRGVDKITAAAERLLDGGEGEPSAGTAGLREQLAEAKHQVAVHDAAVRLQERRLEALRSRFSAKQAGSPYRKLVKAAVAAAAELAKAYDEVQAFRGALEADGVLVSLPMIPGHLQALGRWTDPGSHVHDLITEASKAGFINGEYKDRPQPPGPYDGIPEGKTLNTVAAGPGGVFEATVSRGGVLKRGKQLYEPEPARDEDGWTSRHPLAAQPDARAGTTQIAAGPEGTREVRVGKDGALETVRWISKSADKQETKRHA